MRDIITGEDKDKKDEKDGKSNDSFVDGVKDFAEKNKTAVGLFAFAGAAVGGIWMYKNYFLMKKGRRRRIRFSCYWCKSWINGCRWSIRCRSNIGNGRS